MKVGIIGAGPAGLISGRYLKENGFDFEIFEQTGALGGIWFYTDHTEKDENGVEVHSAMYKNLYTNLPKECTFTLGFPYSEDIKESILPQHLVLEYFRKLADHFELKPHIKYYHRVVNVKPLPENRWSVTIRNLLTKTEETKEFDAVMLCPGHYNKTYMPKIDGNETFKGLIHHSRTYRSPDKYKEQNVLVIGGEKSGQDISIQIATVAKNVYLSHRKEKKLGLGIKNIFEKPEVVKISENEVEFIDGTKQQVDTIIYATGYLYSCPFLSKECKIEIENNWIRYLYKHIVNIEYPTMFFIGVPARIIIIPLHDLQARFVVSVLKKNVTLPSKEEMFEDVKKRLDFLKANGYPERLYHIYPTNKRELFEETAAAGKIQPIPEVILKIYEAHVMCPRGEDKNFRIIDDENFEIID